MLMFVGPLRCLKRIDFLGAFYEISLDVRCCRTFTGHPLTGRIGIDPAILTRGNIKNLAAIATQFYNSMTASPIIPATFLGHEAAVLSTLDGLTNHC